MKLMREARGVLGGTDIWKKSEWALALLSLISSCFAVSVIPFIRKDLGERYFGWLNLWFGYSVVAGFMFFGSLIGIIYHGPMPFPELMYYFWLAFIGVSLYRRWEIHKRNKAGVKWHSMYMGTWLGTSLLPLPISQENIYRFGEPGVVFIVGHFLWNFNWEVGMWLTVSAFALAINNHLAFYQQRMSILDLIDGEIEARYFSEALAGKPAKETCGFVIADSTRQIISADADLQGAFSKLSDELKSLLDEPTKSEGLA